MTSYRNGFEGGTDGAVVTTANSGGAMGDAFSFAAISGAATRTYSSTSPSHGAMGGKLVAATGETVQLGYNIAASDMIKVAVMFRLNSLPSTNDTHILVCRNATTNGSMVRLDATNKLKVTSSGGTVLATAPSALVAGTYYRLEYVVAKGTTATDGRFMIAYYTGSGTTPIWSYDSGATTNTGIEQFTSVRVGKQSGTNPLDMDIDEVRAEDLSTTWAFLGPVPNLDPTVTVGPNQNVTTGATVNLTSTAGDTDGTIASRQWTFDYPTSGAPALTGATSANASFTAGAAGSLYILRHTVTDDGGATASATMEVRVPLATAVSTLPDAGTVVGTFTNTGGAGSRGAALSDSSDTTYLESGTVTSTEQTVRIRLQPSAVRSTGTITVRVAQDTAGSFTTKVRLYQGNTLRQEWTIATSTSISDQAVVLSSGTLAAITDWGNLYLEISAAI